ncbi:MAG: M20/M25/M40 family metallo-hydrolase [Pirellulales bacterium]
MRWAGVGLWGLVCLAWAGGPVRAADGDSHRKAAESITAASLGRHVAFLADDRLEGREAGSRGANAAAAYLAGELRRNGLRGGGPGGGYYQTFGFGYRNVLALLEGSDPALRQQVILVGAHYDHVGYGTRRNSQGPIGYVHNGADDNASGTAGVLEAARAFAQLSPASKRSILFVLWDAEEQGLLGSQHWVAHPTVPLDRVPIVLNVDMIGRLRDGRVEVDGTRTSRGLRELVSRRNGNPGLVLDFSWDMTHGSDDHPFYTHGIPVLTLHTGLHEDFHRPSDDVERINREGMQRVVRFLFAIVRDLADRPQTPSFRAAVRSESVESRRRLEAPAAPLPGRLGVWWDEQDRGDRGALVTRVVAGSAAEKGGLRPGDRIVEFARRPIRRGDALRTAVLAARNPVRVVADRPGEKSPLELMVELPGEPLRLGIDWRNDDAEPGVLALTRVAPGSPCERAGLRPCDRVYEIGGRRFATDEEFRRLASTLSSPVELLVERDGQLKRVRVEVER